MKGSTGTSTVTRRIPNWSKNAPKEIDVIIKLGSSRECTKCKGKIATGRKARLVGQGRLPEHLRCKE